MRKSVGHALYISIQNESWWYTTEAQVILSITALFFYHVEDIRVLKLKVFIY